MKNLNKVIKVIQEKLNEHKVNWAIVGSANMYLQGVDVKHDRVKELITRFDNEFKRAKEFYINRRKKHEETK